MAFSGLISTHLQAGWNALWREGDYLGRGCDDRVVDDGSYIIQAMQVFMMKGRF